MRALVIVQVRNRTPILGNLRDIHYPWHPWRDHKVRVHATLVKRGQAVARCSLEDVQPFRIREVPLWMLDAAACCKIHASKCKVANVVSLRELKDAASARAAD